MMHRHTVFLGVDTGGTFTDFVLVDDRGLTTLKVLSTPDAPERAILQGIHGQQLHQTSGYLKIQFQRLWDINTDLKLQVYTLISTAKRLIWLTEKLSMH